MNVHILPVTQYCSLFGRWARFTSIWLVAGAIFFCPTYNFTEVQHWDRAKTTFAAFNSIQASSFPFGFLTSSHTCHRMSFWIFLAPLSIYISVLFLNFCSSCLTNSNFCLTWHQMSQDSLLRQAQTPPAENCVRICSCLGSGAWVCARTCFNKTIFPSH